MYNIFNSLVKQPLDTLVTVSATYTGSLSSFSIISSESTVSIQLNGGQVSTPFNIVAGDKIDLTFKTSINYSTASYVVYAIGGIKGVVGASTIDSSTAVLKDSYKGLSYFDDLYDNGLKYVRNFSSNQFIKYDLTANTISPIPLSSTPTGKTSSDSTYITEPFSSNIYKVDTSTLEIQKKIDIGGNPTGGVKSVSVIDGKPCVWIVQTNLNSVVCLNSDDTTIFTLTGLNHPLAVDASVDGKTIVVANNSDTVPSITIYTYGSSWTAKQVALPSKPYYSYIDAFGGIWCSSQNSTNLYYVDSATYAITNIPVGLGQRALKSYDNATLYLVCAEDKTLVAINISSKTVSKTWSVPEYPIDLAVINSDIYVASGATSVYKVTTSGAVVKYMSVPSTIYAIDCDNAGNLYSVSLFANQPSFIDIPDVTTTSFYFESPPSVNIGSTYMTDEFKIGDISGAMPVSIPNVMNAKLFIDGVAQQAGTSATIHSGQTFKIGFDIGSDVVNGETIVFPFYLGNKSYLFNAIAKYVDVVVTPFYFDAITGANLSSSYTSNTVVLSYTPLNVSSITLNIVGATIIKNGVDQVGSTAVFANGDSLALRLTTSDKHQSSSYIKVTVGTYENIWSVTTLNDPSAYWVKPTEQDKLLYEDATTSTSIINRLSKITSTGTITSINLDAAPTAVADSLGDYVFVTNFFKDKVYKVNANELLVNSVLSMPVGSRPVSIAEAITSTDDGWDSIAVTLSATDTVRFIKKDGSAYYDLTVGTKPMGICSGGDYMWVANNGSSTISVLQFNFTTSKYEVYSTISIPSSSPYEIYSNLTGGAIFVTDYIQNKVYSLSNNALLKTYDVGTNPYGVVYYGNFIYCANSYDGTITKINVTDGSTTVTKLDAAPDSISVDKNGYIYVTNMENSKVYVYTSAFALYATYDTGYTNTWVSSSTYETAAFTFVAHMYDDVIKSRLQLETNAASEDYVEQLMLPRDTQVTSNAVTIRDLIRPDTITIEGYKNAALVVNGITLDVGAAATINNGDTVAVTLLTSHQYDTSIYAAVTAKAYRKVFHVKTEPKLFPNDMVFLPDYGIVVGETVTSNILTVSGITEGYSASVTCDTEGVIIYINGSPTNTYPVTVSTGDTIQLEWHSTMQFSEIKTIQLLANSVSFGFYKIFAISLNGPERDQVYVNWSLIAGLSRTDYIDSSSVFVEQSRTAMVANVSESSAEVDTFFINVESSAGSPDLILNRPNCPSFTDLTIPYNDPELSLFNINVAGTLVTNLYKSNVVYTDHAMQPDLILADVGYTGHAMQPSTYKSNVEYTDHAMQPDLILADVGYTNHAMQPDLILADVEYTDHAMQPDLILANVEYSSDLPVYNYGINTCYVLQAKSVFADSNNLVNVGGETEYEIFRADSDLRIAAQYTNVNTPDNLVASQATFNSYTTLQAAAQYYERLENFDYSYADKECFHISFEYNDPNTFYMAYADTTWTNTGNSNAPFTLDAPKFVLSDVNQYDEPKASVVIAEALLPDINPHAAGINVFLEYETISTSYVPNIMPLYIIYGAISDLSDRNILPKYIINTGYSDYFATPQYISSGSPELYRFKPVYEVLEQSATPSTVPQTFIKRSQSVIEVELNEYNVMAVGTIYVSPKYVLLQSQQGGIYVENNYYVSNLQADPYEYFNLTFKQREVNITIDTNIYSAADKGSYDSTTLPAVLATNGSYEEVALNDGTLIYHYASINEYSDCINDRYVVTYGLVRGG